MYPSAEDIKHKLNLCNETNYSQFVCYFMANTASRFKGQLHFSKPLLCTAISCSLACSLWQEVHKLTCGRWHSDVAGRQRAPWPYCTRRRQRCACAGSPRILCSSQTTVQSQEALALACHSQYTHGTAETDMQIRLDKTIE